MGVAILKMRNITKRFMAVTALDNVNFELYKGEILALVGENGAGKSTLMKILSGSYPSSSYEGEIEIDGRKMNFNKTSDSERAGIEMIYQEISMNLDLTVAENIFLGKLPKNSFGFVDWKRMNKEAITILNLVGLQIDPRELVRWLSTSQKQLIAIGKALFRNPRILVLDEPTSALTESEAENLMQIILGLKEKGISCIYISHKLDEVFRIADRITVLRDGSNISTFSREEVVADKVIEDMVGRKIEQMYPKPAVPIGNEVLRVENFTVKSSVSSQKNIVENVSFTISAGEILGLGGLVGAGRSELVNAIFGAVKPKCGKVFIEGREVKIDSPADAIKNGMALVTEDRKSTGFVGTMCIRENVTLASFEKIFGKFLLKIDKENQMVDSIIRKLSIKAPGKETNIMNLSGGNQQKVVLAKWLLKDIKVLMLDEPTRGIDVGAKVEIYNLMTELARNGVAIIMISSELPELLAMADRFIILSKGVVSGEFSKQKMTQREFMKAATGVQ